MFGVLEKRLIMAALVLAWLSYLLFRVIQLLGGHLPALPHLIADSPVATRVHRVRNAEEPFTWAKMSSFKPARNLSNPFYPNPTQPSPPPEAPKVRTIELQYQGFYMTSHGEKQAYILVGDQTFIGTMGAKVVANWVIANITVSAVTLQDAAGRKLILDFKVKKPLDIPLS